MNRLATLTLSTLALSTLAGCGAHVSVMRTGTILPEREEGCSLAFLSGEHLAIASGYVQLGMVTFSGTPGQLEASSGGIPGAVQTAACKLGGDAVSLNAAVGSGRTGMVQFLIWHSREADAAPATGEAPPIQTI